VLNYFQKRLEAVGWEGVDWILSVQDRDKWRAFVNGGIS